MNVRLWLQKTVVLAGCLLAVPATAAGNEAAPNVQAAQNECARKQAGGCFQLGQFYFDGLGVPLNKTRAAQWYEKACLLGMDKGCAYAGAVYYRHLGQTEKAVALLQKSCRHQDMLSCSALNSIGGIYMRCIMKFKP